MALALRASGIDFAEVLCFIDVSRPDLAKDMVFLTEPNPKGSWRDPGAGFRAPAIDFV